VRDGGLEDGTPEDGGQRPRGRRPEDRTPNTKPQRHKGTKDTKEIDYIGAETKKVKT
jgi:hypothetical protein